MAQHPIVHIEVPVNDPQSDGRFYAEVFGWDVRHTPEFDYATFAADGGPGGGFPRADGELSEVGRPNVFIGTEDINATLSRVESLGGATVMGKTEIPGYGWFALFTDPSGNRLGLYTAAND